MFIQLDRTDFIITASQDGHVKFWKKKEEEGIEFVKHFRSHLGVPFVCVCGGEINVLIYKQKEICRDIDGCCVCALSLRGG